MTGPRSLILLAALALAPLSFAQIERGEPLLRRPALGMQIRPLTLETAQGAGLTEAKGVLIGTITEGLSAQKWGLQTGDILTKLAGEPVTAAADVTRILASLKTGQEVAVEFIRGRDIRTARAPLAPRPFMKADGFRVHYDQVVSQGKRIRVIATHPATPGPHPTIFMIGGIGQYSIDGDYATTGYGNVLASFADRYTIIRVDKPGQGDSEGPAYSELGFGQEEDAYLQALRLAKTFEFVDPQRIAIFGHSMGGCFGPFVASQEKVAGVAVYGTLTKTWTEYLLENSRRQMALGGGAPGDVNNALRDLAQVSHHVFIEGLSPQQIIERRPELADAVRGNIPDGRTYSGVGLGFWRELAARNLSGAWLNVDAKVLAMWGENEFIATQWDHEEIARIVNGVRPGTAEYKMVAGSDHGFFKTTSALDSMTRWGQGAEFNPEVIRVLDEWLKRTLAGA
jgi:hypothetical protein